MAFWNEREVEEEEVRGSLVVFIIATVLLGLGLVAVVFLVKHSRSKSSASEIGLGGYQKLGSGRHGAHGSASHGSHGSRFQEAQLVDIGIKEGEDDDEEDEDIVYMGRDGTVYRKFRYGEPGGETEDELEYDDESYAFR